MNNGVLVTIIVGLVGIIATYVITKVLMARLKIKVTMKEVFNLNLDELRLGKNSEIVIDGQTTREVIGLDLNFYIRAHKDFEHKDPYEQGQIPKLKFKNFQVLAIRSYADEGKSKIPLAKRNNDSEIDMCIQRLKGRYVARFRIIGKKTGDEYDVEFIEKFIKDCTIRFSKQL